jgi:hypothetical protein
MKKGIEEDVSDLCEKFNSINGFETIYSCQGHPREGRRPYIMFLSSVGDAGKLNNLLSSAQKTESLHYTWWITASFNDKAKLQFKLETNDYRVSGCARLLFFSSWNHKLIVNDFNTIEKLLSLNF